MRNSNVQRRSSGLTIVRLGHYWFEFLSMNLPECTLREQRSQVFSPRAAQETLSL